MKKFELVLDTKVSGWRRTYCEVKAETLEEAVKKVSDFDYDFVDSEFLYETEEIMNPEDNENEPTVEIFDETVTTCLYHN